MPNVNMPDGKGGTVVVDMPDNPTPEQKQMIQAIIAKQHDVRAPEVKKEDEEALPTTYDPGSLLLSATKNAGMLTDAANKGIAEGVGGAVDLANMAAKLPAAVAAGHPSYVLDEQPKYGSKWFEDVMKQHNLITGKQESKTTGQKVASGMVEGATSLLSGAGVTKAGEEATVVAKRLLRREPPTGIIPNEQQANIVKDLRKEGYVFSPAQIKPTIANKTVTGLAGKSELLQDASIKNQEVSNNLIRSDLGVSINTPLNETTLKLVRNEANDTYNKVRALPDNFKLDTKYIREISDLNSEFAALEAKFPGLTKSPETEELKKILINDKALAEGITPSEAIDLSRVLRQKATANFKLANGQNGKPESLALAQAQREAANAVENVISKGIKDSKFPGLYKDWVEARKKLAISHDVESALNPDTSNISAAAVAGLAKKGKPLSGGMEKVAQFGRSFGRTAQTPEKISGVSENARMEMIAAGLGTLAGNAVGGPVGGAVGLVAGAAARPTTRAALLSKPYQDFITGVKRGPKKKVIPRVEEED